jgi:hypothetical protein
MGHNVILVDGKGQSPGPKERTAPIDEQDYKITEEWDYASGSFARFEDMEGEVNHTRSVLYVRGEFWIVLDKISTDRPRKIAALWHWHPECTVEKVNENGVATTNEQGNLLIQPVGSIDWTIDLVKGQEVPHIQGWYSEVYNKVEPNTASVFSTGMVEDATMVWLLYPSEKKILKVDAKILNQDKDMVQIQVTKESGDQWDLTVPFEAPAKVKAIKRAFN